LTLVERLHRRLLDVIKDEFDRRGRADINSVQALLLYNIGDKELTAGELRTRGYYLGSNVSYNLKKLVELGFLDHQRSRVDRRSVRIRLTPQGQEIRRIVDSLYQKHVKTVEQVGGISGEEFSTLNKSLHRLERFWTDQILYRL
jgi:DNA-binding MarR family transcriptional regulator